MTIVVRTYLDRRGVRSSNACLERGRELISRVEPELSEDTREMPFHRAGGDEERLRVSRFVMPCPREPGDWPLACRQRVESGEHDAPRARPGRPEFRLGVLGERSRGTYRVLFDTNITACAYVATAGRDNASFVEDYHVYTSRTGTSTVNVEIFDEKDNPLDLPFHLAVLC